MASLSGDGLGGTSSDCCIICRSRNYNLSSRCSSKVLRSSRVVSVMVFVVMVVKVVTTKFLPLVQNVNFCLWRTQCFLAHKFKLGILMIESNDGSGNDEE